MAKLTYEEAEAIALKYNPRFTNAIEYLDAWYFYVESNGDDIICGGGDTPLAVKKKDGKKMLAYEYLMSDGKKRETGKEYVINKKAVVG